MKLEEDVIIRLFSNFFALKVIKAVLFTIESHEKDILAVSYDNKTINTQDKWSQLNLMQIKYLIRNNHCLILSHMAKSYIFS